MFYVNFGSVSDIFADETTDKEGKSAIDFGFRRLNERVIAETES